MFPRYGYFLLIFFFWPVCGRYLQKSHQISHDDQLQPDDEFYGSTLQPEGSVQETRHEGKF